MIPGLIGAALLLGATGCSGVSPDSYEKADVSESFAVKDLDSLYEDERQDPVIYVTVGRETEDSKDKDKSWEAVNGHDLSWYEQTGEKPYDCDALVQFGTEEGPTSRSFGYGNMSPNATIRLSGDKASTRPQKSYRIKIKSGSGNVDGMKSFVLSKSFGDPFRFSNMLCYELMREADDIMSTRTRFVHLYVRDETEDDKALFVDYGYYTMIEPVNKRYLRNRNLDESGELYKAVDFDFGRYEGVIKEPTDADYDKDEFEKILEAKGSNDYSKLINMLDAFNDGDCDVED
ncbi:MAG: CotH kinase family protein, partial [Lachnospiraceae bacterium]|nr:CotH kinase family protein [Lachnospiraceae bacterium]